MTPSPSTLDRHLAETVEAVRARATSLPAVGVVLDSEDAAFAGRLRNAVTLETAALPHMPAGEGRIVLGFVDDVPVACLVGRKRLGEGVPAWQIVHGVRVLARLGVKAALVTESAAAIEPTWEVGDMMLVVDHVNLASHDGLGAMVTPPFAAYPAMGGAYDVALAAELHEVVRTEKVMSARIGTSAMVDVFEGVYANLPDPTYETPAQVHVLRTMGAHATGAGLALEITALRQLGVRAAALVQLTRRAGERPVPVAVAPGPTHLSRLLRGWVVRAHRVDGSSP